MGTNTNINCFSPQSDPHTVKFYFCVALKHFGGNSLKISLFSQKLTISERSSEILRMFVFLKKSEKWQILRKVWICLNNSFWSNQLKGTNTNINCFSPQSDPRTVKLCFSVVLKHFWGNSLKTCQKIYYLRKKLRNT